MEVIILPEAEDAAQAAACLLAGAVKAHPDAVLGLATGRTMERVYAHLVSFHLKAGLDFSRCRTFNLDEYIGLPREHPGSYHHYMETHFFRHMNLLPGNAHVPDGTAVDLDEACRAYEEAIVDAGGIDLQLLGLGLDGHIGFNEPDSEVWSTTRQATLTPTTLHQNAAAFGGDVHRVPPQAITMGMRTILQARRILLLATGSAKARILAQALEGPVCATVPASYLQWHPCCRVIIDAEASAGLSKALATGCPGEYGDALAGVTPAGPSPAGFPGIRIREWTDVFGPWS